MRRHLMVLTLLVGVLVLSALGVLADTFIADEYGTETGRFVSMDIVATNIEREIVIGPSVPVSYTLSSDDPFVMEFGEEDHVKEVQPGYFVAQGMAKTPNDYAGFRVYTEATDAKADVTMQFVSTDRPIEVFDTRRWIMAWAPRGIFMAAWTAFSLAVVLGIKKAFGL